MPRRSRNALLSMAAMALHLRRRVGPADSEAACHHSVPAGTPAAGTGGIRGEIPGHNEVLATVIDGNLTDKVTRGDVLRFLSRYQIPEEEDRQELYNGAVERLMNTKLLMMFLARQQLPVRPEQIDEQVEQLSRSSRKTARTWVPPSFKTISRWTAFASNTKTASGGRNISRKTPPRPPCAATRASTAISSAERSSGRATS